MPAPAPEGAAHPDPRAALAALRADTLALIRGLDRDVAAIVEARQDANSDDEHDPEGATLAFERSQSDAMIREARVRLADVDAAVARLDAGAYGRCEVCGEPIPAGRLEIRPAARRCVAHA
ncbi:TraR/DksA family transcriptional regulator [Clavibacter tessellarius]|uniref:TraR/DksA family transcriptional regulator n=1 Tax=Clavibacter TaxID=1573 RepID=UPI000D1BB94E